MPIHAPYNFVPLSKKVFFPEWAEQVSQDIPFSDGISGEITCTLTAASPIYVRNGGNWTHEEIMANQAHEAQSFFKVGNEYIIPGTSLKGMLRNVIEIISFGKMGRVDEHRYSVRDLQNPAIYGNFMTETTGPNIFRTKVKAAWLSQDTQRKWHLTPCDVARVEREDLMKFHPKQPNLRSRQSAVDKYHAWGGHSLSVRFNCTPEQPHRHSQGRQLIYKRVTQLGSTGQLEGTIVLTGQPAPDTPQHNPGRKHLEFIFFDAREEQTRPLSNSVKNDFSFIHSDEKGNPNAEWEFWNKKLETGKRVPVFYLGTIGAPQSIGLAMMYRLPYQNTIIDVIKHTSSDHLHQKMDLPETMFGWAGEPEGLKGRIWISQATASNAASEKTVTTILNSPKPTYYPSYIEQPKPVTKYKTLMDNDSRLRGWKRYPTRAFRQEDVNRPSSEQMRVATRFTPLKSGTCTLQSNTKRTRCVATRFTPLKSGTRFTFKVKVHNLKPAELGALLWALEWGGDANLCHSLGMGKSYGYGQVKVNINNTAIVGVAGSVQSIDGLREIFEKLMDREVGGDWRQTLQMHQLLGMANPANATGKYLQHMTISPNQFIDGKKEKERLEPHVSNNGLKSDEERFKKLIPQVETKNSVAASKSTTTAQQIAISLAPTPTEKWENVQLTYAPGNAEFSVVGKKATVKRTAAAPLVPDEIVARIKKKGFVKAHVTVEPCGGGAYKIITAEVG